MEDKRTDVVPIRARWIAFFGGVAVEVVGIFLSAAGGYSVYMGGKDLTLLIFGLLFIGISGAFMQGAWKLYPDEEEETAGESKKALVK